ncbi:uncharacterized protein LAESUDRAFT_717906 [Laetiporus sulphureus 93-53]|uniref:Uncharacterized protein n=1 Tax=Laetiporus sulphureus 93-53 TaxID=1314785 RepID=A0A165BDY2_9APHY|nr:uncharacterized protein LAESUDRAFT_717906 [Laetiporus sulphureus 93-53]KZT00839.1 hypothetical protein LAESUDRAFT_717906 [Laetiporus sulphureus 93-53]
MCIKLITHHILTHNVPQHVLKYVMGYSVSSDLTFSTYQLSDCQINVNALHHGVTKDPQIHATVMSLASHKSQVINDQLMAIVQKDVYLSKWIDEQKHNVSAINSKISDQIISKVTYQLIVTSEKQPIPLPQSSDVAFIYEYEHKNACLTPYNESKDDASQDVRTAKLLEDLLNTHPLMPLISSDPVNVHINIFNYWLANL